MLRLSSCLAACALAGCGVGEHVPVTYSVDVAPRLARSCLGCHDNAEGERPSLAALADVRARAPEMLSAVERKTMPPGGIDRSGACNTFVGPAPFSDEDIEAVRAWIDGGMLEGDAASPARAATASGASQVAPRFSRKTDVELPLAPAAGSAPPDGNDDAHRCYLVHLDDPGDLVGVSVTQAPSLHHAMVFALPPGGAAQAQALDARDEAPGWDCPSTSLVDGATLAFAWVPGPSTVAFPDGAGVALGTDAVVQLHTHGEASGTVAMSLLLDDVARQVRVVPMALAGFSLPPGNPAVELADSIVFPGGDADVIGVMPHLHQAGRSASLVGREPAAERCFVNAPRFDYAFQEVAFYERPMRVGAGAPMRLACSWDTSNRTTPTPWGESSDDEMCTVFLFTTSPS